MLTCDGWYFNSIKLVEIEEILTCWIRWLCRIFSFYVINFLVYYLNLFAVIANQAAFDYCYLFFTKWLATSSCSPRGTLCGYTIPHLSHNPLNILIRNLSLSKLSWLVHVTTYFYPTFFYSLKKIYIVIAITTKIF